MLSEQSIVPKKEVSAAIYVIKHNIIMVNLIMKMPVKLKYT
jgi:hypothetical protein